MAILKEIEVVIRVNGQELKEYDDEDASNDNESSVSKYVEATSGAQFQIATTAPRSYQFSSDALLMKIYVDGVYVEGSLLRKKDAGWTRGWDQYHDGPRRFDGDRWEVKPFKFMEIKAVENELQTPDDTSKYSHIKDLGTINIEFCRRMVLGKGAPRIWKYDKDIGGASALTEKQLKGKSLTHGVAFGDVRKIADCATYETRPVDGKDSPVAKFIFKYCSRKALQDLLLIPRTPSPPLEPTPLPLEERNMDELSPEEIRELGRRQQARYRMERDAIKNETGTKREETKAEHGMKREYDEEYDELMRSAITKKVKIRAFEHGETVELD
ncbi:hypothetical protein JMJ35_003140 [Cladonia borealis]|uniref:DUF7918 domain-containing protein n=1 Tax=Cladonia borealis TaxID=184061 RepID=A0AA39R741_9LECA|nr:hypothetical protein JMJ35_003140 [Cladonia borealis]